MAFRNLPLRRFTADRIALSAVAGGTTRRRDPRRVRCRRRGIGCRGLGSCCDASAVAPTAARTAARTARSMIFCMSGDTIRA